MIKRSQLSAIRNHIEKLDTNTRTVAERVLLGIDPSDYDAIRAALDGVLKPVIQESSQLSANLAASVYNEWRKADIGTTANVAARSAFKEEKFASMVNTAISKPTMEESVNVVMSYAGYTNRASYSYTMFSAGRNDTVKPKFARVPEDDEACEFCMMLASRDFEYYSGSEGDEVHNHANCRCVYAASWDEEPRAQGYDSGQWYDRWQESIDARAEEAALRKGTAAEQERDAIMKQYAQSSANWKRRNKRR